MIKRAGRNIYPQELEDFIGGLDGIRKGCVAAFASPDPHTGTERLIVIAETRLIDPPQLDRLRRSIVEPRRAFSISRRTTSFSRRRTRSQDLQRKDPPLGGTHTLRDRWTAGWF